MSRIRVVVTAEDIAAGHRFFVGHCPIALAVQRQGYPNARVDLTDWRPSFGAPRLPISRAASRFIRAFDARRPVQPATFLIEGPSR